VQAGLFGAVSSAVGGEINGQELVANFVVLNSLEMIVRLFSSLLRAGGSW